MNKYIPLAFILIAFTGCGTPIEDELTKEDSSKINDNYTPAANNQQSASNKDTNSQLPGQSGGTSLGYIGSDVKLGENKITENYWSLYIATDVQNSYNTYIYGYKFYQNGSLSKRDASIEYKSYLKSWGVDATGTTLTISPDEKYSITSRFTTDKNCYLVSTALISSAKLCNETAPNTNLPKNGSGHYGSGVKFGNYDYGNVDAVGNWEFNAVQNGTVSGSVYKKFTLNSDGKSSSGDEWGVSDDGKSMVVGTERFLIYKYYAQSCFHISKIDNGSITEQYQACKK